MYLVKEICGLNNVANLWLATDPNAPRPIDHLDSLIEDAAGVCLAIDCEDFSEIENNIDKLKKAISRSPCRLATWKKRPDSRRSLTASFDNFWERVRNEKIIIALLMIFAAFVFREHNQAQGR